MNKVKKEKLDTSFLVFEPNVFVERQLAKAKSRRRLTKTVFISFNIISFIATFALLALATIVFANLAGNGTPDWYFTVTTGIAAMVALITTLANFFYVKEKQVQYQAEIEYIEAEIAFFQLGLKEYSNQKTKEYILFHNVTAFIGYNAAKEDENE